MTFLANPLHWGVRDSRYGLGENIVQAIALDSFHPSLTYLPTFSHPPFIHPHPFNSCLLFILILMSLITFPAFSLSAFLQGPLCLVSSEPTVCFRVLGHCTCLSAPRMPSPPHLLSGCPPGSLPSTKPSLTSPGLCGWLYTTSPQGSRDQRSWVVWPMGL